MCEKVINQTAEAEKGNNFSSAFCPHQKRSPMMDDENVFFLTINPKKAQRKFEKKKDQPIYTLEMWDYGPSTMLQGAC